ncbi:cyclic peptide export ABC transporter [Azospirillum sp. ST 5-10]|uniref:cyclic peptide export ABC transporter n=1 Tax=unclassified Azospirillum TaxID=2630922 RepID=UPI003F4A5396
MARSRSHHTFAELTKLLRPHWHVLLAATVLGMVGGASVTALLATINAGLQEAGGTSPSLLLAFAGFCVVALAGSILSDMGTNYVGQHVIARLREDLGRKILMAPVDRLERYRTHRLIPVLTHDVDVISDFAFCFAPLAVALTITLGCLVYLAALSWTMFLATALAVVIGSIIQYVAQSRGLKGFAAARELEDEMQKNYRALAEGAKELRINRPRRESVFVHKLQGTAERIRDVQIRSINLYVVAKTLGSTLFFIVIGVALGFQSLWPSADTATLSGFVLVLLYMKGPLELLVATLPVVGRAQVAFQRIAELSAEFSTPEPDLVLSDEGRPRPEMRSIALEGARYAFPPPETGEPFVLGPVDLRLAAGELLFIVGDNGSGKTTLIKLLLGLYKPQSGRLLWNGEPVSDATRDDYRQLFTTVFADYFLFEDLGRAGGDLPAEAARYLERLEIAHKVSVADGHFSTTDLSTGQRKRLALIQAWLEHRPVLVFDEWAADQDPTFRRIFYTEILQDLKRLGKTIVVISHDDRYFHVADRVVRLDAGRLADVGRPERPANVRLAGGAEA